MRGDSIAVLVVNERAKEFRWTSGKRGQNDKRLLPGETAVLSDSEFQEIPIEMRGPGGVRALSPGPDDAFNAIEKTELDYYTVAGSLEIRYLGEAPQTALTSDPAWTIKRFTHAEIVTGDVRITEIQVLKDVVWDNRASLAWL